MKIDFFGKSDIGRVRNTNEDYFSSKKINDTEHLFIIADGMGGHQAGEVASKLGTTIFIRNYEKSRKEGMVIEKSMLYSLKKANTSILKKALSDPQKKGMGTTFTALVLSEYKANITHIGDSRIYLIRNNKIKRITTDHTFVEKMLQEGKINKEEAQDHPQKNILYMSLGARESYFPEILSNIEIKKGDIIAMCSDGLNNMIGDEEIKKIALAYSPEKSVKELIKKANKSGGSDNITIQIIQINRSPKKTAKKKYHPVIPKTMLLTAIFLFISIFFLYNLNRISPRLIGKNTNKLNLISAKPIPELKRYRNFLNPTIIKIDNLKLPKNISFQNLLYLSEDILYLRYEENLILCSIKNQNTKKFRLGKEDNFIPAPLMFTAQMAKPSIYPNGMTHGYDFSTAYTFILQKKRLSEYQIINYNKNEVLITIQSDPELNSIDHESGTIKFLNLQEPLIPIFMNQRAFIFHDQNHFYVIENPVKENDRETKFYKISNLSYSSSGIISIKNFKTKIKIFFFDTPKQTIKIFEIPPIDYIPLRKIQFKFIEKPLNIEYFMDDSLIIYFSYGFIILKKNNAFVQHYYLYNKENLFIKKILIDVDKNNRILMDKQNRIFMLKL